MIDHQIKNSSLISKALYRRALARRSMGGKWVTAALNDLDLLIKMDPENKTAILERTRTLQLVKESKDNNSLPQPPTANPSSTGGGDVMGDMKAVSTRKLVSTGYSHTH